MLLIYVYLLNYSHWIANNTIFVQVNSILPESVYAPNGSCVRNAEININVAVSQIKEDFMQLSALHCWFSIDE